jgi:hypothetical protein
VIDRGVGLRDRALIGLMAYTFARIGALAFPPCRRVPSRFTQERPSAQRKPGNLWTLPRGQRFKLSARVRTARESRGYATDAAMGALTGGIWTTLARGGAGDRLAKAKSASAAPTLATTAALIGRT